MLISRTLLKHCLSILLSLEIVLTGSLFAFAEIQRVGPLRKVHAITTRPEWNQFRILVWQYKTSALEDIDLYRQAGLGGFHINRGAGEDKLVEFSMKEHFPYYVDHTADKGFLYLKGNDIKAVTGKHGLVIRPHSLADPKTIVQIKQHIARNITATQNGLVLAYAFDDEISLGRLSTPRDVDIHPKSLSWFRRWLKHKHGSISRLNAQWETHFNGFDEVMPKDDSLLVEEKGLQGKAYFDARWTDPGDKKTNSYALYDRSIHRAAKIVRKSNLMPVILDDKQRLFQPGECPEAALYCGWYSLGRYVDAFDWKPGAVGYHIASGECKTLKSKKSHVWCKMMLEKGVAATLGPVGEPYVQAFPVPEVFFGLLIHGKLTLAECYAAALPFLSWKMVLIGDPLYSPFTNIISVPEQ